MVFMALVMWGWRRTAAEGERAPWWLKVVMGIVIVAYMSFT